MTGHSSFEEFFRRYAASMMGMDVGAVAAAYAPSFFVAGPRGSGTFANDGNFIGWLENVRRSNQDAGMTSIEPLSLQEEWLSDTHALVTVNWGSTFAKTGGRTIAFKITYVMQRLGGPWQILGYISHTDQEEEMREMGLI